MIEHMLTIIGILLTSVTYWSWFIYLTPPGLFFLFILGLFWNA